MAKKKFQQAVFDPEFEPDAESLFAETALEDPQGQEQLDPFRFTEYAPNISAQAQTGVPSYLARPRSPTATGGKKIGTFINDLPTKLLGTVPANLAGLSGSKQDIVDYWNSIKGTLTPEQLTSLGEMTEIRVHDTDLIGEVLGLNPSQIANALKETEFSLPDFGRGEGRETRLTGGRRLVKGVGTGKLSPEQQILRGLGALTPGTSVEWGGNWDVYNLMKMHQGGSEFGSGTDFDALLSPPENIPEGAIGGADRPFGIGRKSDEVDAAIGTIGGGGVGGTFDKGEGGPSIGSFQPDPTANFETITLPDGQVLHFDPTGGAYTVGAQQAAFTSQEARRLRESHAPSFLDKYGKSIVLGIASLVGGGVLGAAFGAAATALGASGGQFGALAAQGLRSAGSLLGVGTSVPTAGGLALGGLGIAGRVAASEFQQKLGPQAVTPGQALGLTSGPFTPEQVKSAQAKRLPSSPYYDPEEDLQSAQQGVV
jgi:hypothetical protein